MKALYDRVPDMSRPAGILVAIELMADTEVTSDQFGSSLLDAQVKPTEVPGHSSFLGYDVADSGLISGLCNCGYSTGEKKELQTQWSDKLNEHGLFQNLEDAKRFKAVTDRRVAEHAPFWVFALYRLSQARR